MPFARFIERVDDIDELGVLAKWKMVERTNLCMFFVFALCK